MKAIRELEKKINLLVEKVTQIKARNADLDLENIRLKDELKALKTNVLNETMNVEELNQEKKTTKNMVGTLIGHIDSLIENNQ